MRVLYLHQYFNTLEMSGSTRSYEFAKRLAEKGHHVDVVTSRTDGLYHSYHQETIAKNLVVHWLPVKYSNSMGFFRRLAAFFSFAVLSSWISLKLRPTLVFATSTPLTIILPAVVASRFKSVPIVFEVRDLWPSAPIASGLLSNPILVWMARMLEQFSYWVSDAVVALSPGMAEGVRAVSKRRMPIYTIPNSCDIALFQSAGFRDVRPHIVDFDLIFNKPVVLYAGAIGSVNGLEFLVDLAAKVGDEVNFLIVGDGSRKPFIIDYAEQIGVNEVSLFIRPYLPKAVVPDLFKRASVGANIVKPIDEYKNNSANKFFDSLAAARPVLLNQAGWMSDLVISHQAGFLIQDVDDEKAVGDFLSVIRDHAELFKYGGNALALGAAQFDRDELFKKLECILMEFSES